MEELISQWGYLILFAYSFGGGLLALSVAGVFSASGELNIIITLIVAGSANFIGDIFLFQLAKRSKKDAQEYINKYRRKVAYTKLLIKKYGVSIIFIQKYIYGVKTLVPLLMGITKYDFNKFLFFNIFASILWALVVGLISFFLGEYIIDMFAEYSKYFVIGFIIVLFLIFRKKL